jgi:hypothetical protein
MLIFALYLVALASPLFVFGLVTLAASRAKRQAQPKKPNTAASRRKWRPQDADAEMAVLEAQFIVAPRMAYDEAQLLLAKVTRPDEVQPATVIDRRSFEQMLRELATSRSHGASHR